MQHAHQGIIIRLQKMWWALATVPIGQLVGVVFYIQEVWTVVTEERNRSQSSGADIGGVLTKSMVSGYLPPSKNINFSSGAFSNLPWCKVVSVAKRWMDGFQLLCAVWQLFFRFYLSSNFIAKEGQVVDWLQQSVPFPVPLPDMAQLEKTVLNKWTPAEKLENIAKMLIHRTCGGTWYSPITHEKSESSACTFIYT